jgi:hypothetical protein
MMILNEPKRPLVLGNEAASISRDNIMPSQQGLRRKLQVRKVDRGCQSPRIAVFLTSSSWEILIYNLAGGFEHFFHKLGIIIPIN